MLILKSPSASDALTLPLVILSNCKPTTALAEMFVNPDPSPINDPVKNEPDIEPLINREPVISVFEFILTFVPSSLMFESPIWSPPIDFGILSLVNVCSSPNEPVFLGPAINIAPP